ncbi:hypothetical protein BDB00DRAFT_937378 [Zychaea mexicana]|uniref:uncharacterized protein n=1 Tax=Zychaea mexicana TaxID=64656 RepID=UPI0022FE85FB|nr:uncharacterized protein BDB00DRAFT_937378 [Zychaea mexicana]KAI9495827.1 hypothetical protein BDB00DRAFT_937378 [Zychaea mexicana]
MLAKLFVIASIGLAAANAQFQFKDTYPAAYTVPTPKPEWLDLIKDVKITNAPPLTTENGVLVTPSNVNEDPYCTWTFTQCLGPDDVHTCPTQKWSLTYDDGPSQYTPKLLDFLKEINEKATFFVVGGQVLQYPEILKRAYDEGHEIAMHSWSHKNMATLTNEELVGELKWNEQVIKEVIGVSPRFFRPPFGNMDDRVRDIVKALGFTPVIWSVDTNDWYLTEHADTFPVSYITGNVTQWASQAATTGGNSLGHDLYAETVDAAIEYIPILSKAFDLTSVGECNNLQSYKEGAGNITPQPSKSGDAATPSNSSESQKEEEEKKEEKKDEDKKKGENEDEDEDEDSEIKAQEDDNESGASTLFRASSSGALMIAAAVAAVLSN